MPRFEIFVDAQTTVSALLVIDAKDEVEAYRLGHILPLEWHVEEPTFSDRCVLRITEIESVEPKLTELETLGNGL
jgi:hypothetical protein